MKTRKLTLGALTVILLVGAGLALAGPATRKDPPAKKQAPLIQDVRAQTKQFIAWADSISLTPEQQKIKEEVLSSIPTVCCRNFSMKTCCCPCNMARAIWGLSNHMLVHDGADTKQLRVAVLEWTRFVGTSGFTGDACFTGGCGRPFAKNGCGGMDDKQIVF